MGYPIIGEKLNECLMQMRTSGAVFRANVI